MRRARPPARSRSAQGASASILTGAWEADRPSPHADFISQTSDPADPRCRTLEQHPLRNRIHLAVKRHSTVSHMHPDALAPARQLGPDAHDDFPSNLRIRLAGNQRRMHPDGIRDAQDAFDVPRFCLRSKPLTRTAHEAGERNDPASHGHRNVASRKFRVPVELGQKLAPDLAILPHLASSPEMQRAAASPAPAT